MTHNELPKPTWTDHKGRVILIHTMSNRWLNNIRKRFRDNPTLIKDVVEEIKRRKQEKS